MSSSEPDFRPFFPWRWRRGMALLVLAPLLAAAWPRAVHASGASPDAGARTQALTAFAQGVQDAKHGRVQEAEDHLKRAARFAPIRDAATWKLVRLLYHEHQWSGALAAADRYPLPASDYFHNAIALDAARSANNLNRWTEVLRWTQQLTQGSAPIYLRAVAEASEGHRRAAAKLERELIYRFPTSWGAKHVYKAWHRHLKAMPDLKPDWQLIATRARALDRAHQPRTAALDWAWAAREAPAKERPGLEMSEARSLRHAGRYTESKRLTRRLLHGPERAQALEFEIELARAVGTEADFRAPLAALAKEFPHSRWYAMALDQAGNSSIIAADGAAIQKYFGRLAEVFPNSGYAPAAAWHATWVAYREQQASTPKRLEEYLKLYPTTSAAADALYWRGRWAETHGRAGLARDCFAAAATTFPGAYFGLRAKQRLEKPPRKRAKKTAAPSWLQPFLQDAPTPQALPLQGHERFDLQRAEWLDAAGLHDSAAVILRGVLHQQKAGDASLRVAHRLAEIDTRQNDFYGAITAMLHAVPHYLELRQDQLPLADWKLLFPAPYSRAIEAAAKREDVNPNLLRALIRQESAFNTHAMSSARARGLMQLMLSTARGLAGRKVRASELWRPDLNIRLGSRFFHALLTRFQDPAYALAGYNAGASRVVQWQQTYAPDGIDEFIESIPFSQTRSYVKAVLRNEAHYAEIYGGS